MQNYSVWISSQRQGVSDEPPRLYLLKNINALILSPDRVEILVYLIQAEIPGRSDLRAAVCWVWMLTVYFSLHVS